MTISWGAVSGHEQVGIEVTTSSYDTNSTSIHIYVDYYVRSVSWGFADNQTLTAWGSISNSWNYTLNSPTGGSVQLYVGRHTISNYPISYSGGPTLTFGGTVSGHYQGATPSHSINWSVPARPANVPTAPGVSASNVTASSAYITVTAANPRGATIVEYSTEVDNNSDFSSPVATWGGGSGSVTGLSPSTQYYARSRARNSVGWGAWSSSATFTTGASVPGAPTSPGSDTIGDVSANITWTAPASDGGSAITNYTVQIATNSVFSSGVQEFTDDGSPYALTSLIPSTQYWVRIRANNAVGAGAWSTSINFTTLAGTPTILTPAASAVRTNGYALAVVEALGLVPNEREIRVEFSQDNTFVSGVTALTLTPSSVSGNNQYTLANTAAYQVTGTWYARARVKNTITLYETPWSATTTFTQAHTPVAVSAAPVAGETVAYAATTSFSWTFSDVAHPYDLQTYYRLYIENNSTGDSIYDSTKTALATSAGNAIASVEVALSSSLKNTVLRWRVEVWDTGDTKSALTPWNLFTLADAPVVTIVTPPTAQNVDSGAPTFSWTVAVPSGGSQLSATVEVYDDETDELVWLGSIVGAGTSITPEYVILSNGKDYYYTISSTDAVGLTGTASDSFLVEYASPLAVAYVATSDQIDDYGYVSVDWTGADADAEFSRWKVYRREATSTTWELLATVGNLNTRSYSDYLVIAGKSYVYCVTQVATRSGIMLESPLGYWWNGTAEAVDIREAEADLTTYWIINAESFGSSIKLSSVKSDDSTLEFESETYGIIGGGRHRDYGDELGYKGTIVCSARTVERPSTLRESVEGLRRSQALCYLRTPFGRLIKVALGDVGWSALPGVGTAEMGELTITYEEVA